MVDNPFILCKLSDVIAHHLCKSDGGGDGIITLFREGHVRTFTSETHIKFLRDAKEHARPAADGSHGHIAGYMQCDNRFNLIPLDKAFVQDAHSPALAFFRGLKEEEQVLIGCKLQTSADQSHEDGHMHVVSAGMHTSVVQRSKVAFRIFHDGQSVHISPKQPVSTRSGAVFDQDAGAVFKAVNLEFGGILRMFLQLFIQEFQQDSRRLMFLKSELRILVQSFAQCV